MQPLRGDPDFQRIRSAIWQRTSQEPVARPLTQRYSVFRCLFALATMLFRCSLPPLCFNNQESDALAKMSFEVLWCVRQQTPTTTSVQCSATHVSNLRKTILLNRKRKKISWTTVYLLLCSYTCSLRLPEERPAKTLCLLRCRIAGTTIHIQPNSDARPNTNS